VKSGKVFPPDITNESLVIPWNAKLLAHRTPAKFAVNNEMIAEAHIRSIIANICLRLGHHHDVIVTIRSFA
jgi:hypothetical protein